MEILTASHLTKQYGQGPNLVKALDDVSISIHQGEFVAIIGTSGSGKSTLLNMLGGLDRPTSGSVKVDRFELGKLKDEDLTVFRRQRIGFIFQNYNLVPILSAYENIVLPMQLDRKRPDERFLEKVVTLLGLEKKLNSMPNQLSGGQQQRVAIARALASKPAIVLADEPIINGQHPCVRRQLNAPLIGNLHLQILLRREREGDIFQRDKLIVVLIRKRNLFSIHQNKLNSIASNRWGILSSDR